jgi:DNA polymerase III epsilon subunit-like protein
MKPHDYITPQWLTIEGVRRYSGLSSNTIYNYINTGHIVSAMVKLPGNHRGRRLINRASLDAFIERYVVGTKREADQQHRALLDLLSTAADVIAEARRIAAGFREEKDEEFPSIIR